MIISPTSIHDSKPSRQLVHPGNRLVAAGAIYGFLGIALGAFGTHVLATRLTESELNIFRTGAQYQMYQALALIGLGLWCNYQRQRMTLTGASWIAGTLIFSGSLYALALTDIKLLGAITPIGGLLLLLGWIVFAFRAWNA